MKLEAIGIVAKDLAEAVRFYRLLGLDFPEPRAKESHLEATTPEGVRIMLDSQQLMKQVNPAWVAPVGQGIVLAFRCASPAEVDAAYRKIVTAGYDAAKEPWDAFWGQRYASVRDPDGNAVDLFAPLDAKP